REWPFRALSSETNASAVADVPGAEAREGSMALNATQLAANLTAQLLAQSVDFESARLSFRPTVAQWPHSPEEEDVLAADVGVLSKPSTGLLRMTTSMPTVQQQHAADSSTIQGAMTKDCAHREESTNQQEAVLVDSGDPMNVQSSGGPVIPGKRDPPVIVHQQDTIASEQPPRKVRAMPDNASTLSASQSYPTPAPSQSYRVHIDPS
ncbi:hypothetical protein MRX96_003312, partial [Rhipicephalus microplus]